ncbi:peptidoglycan/LPS O-acetylase OafA/YrhL [Rhizobium wenxiniae]|uniref:Peptidoglycan/LPS O-acetylase OafA/YrhL n=2 Tax=Rhizobium wenxiniae TaxID=1737357 RepID=A0A7W9Y368_9HYPH|nr:peptidoglycan/LPS O-acetylase OafA/YrhL [Rhizobium wenxiniae]
MLLPASLVGISAFGLKTFFFISGFLITRLLLAEYRYSNNVSLSAFYGRRFIRLYPVLITYVAVVWLVAIVRQQHVDIIDPLAVFFYFVNYLAVFTDGGGHTLPIGLFWSLSVEEHFYLVAPIVIFFLRGDARKILIFAVAVCVFSLFLRLLYVELWPGIEGTLHIYWRSETRFDSIAYGMILACCADIKAGRRLIQFISGRFAVAAAAFVLLGSFAIRDDYFQMTWRFSIQGLALIPLISAVIFARTIPIANYLLNSTLMVWIGVLSYSLYVWHGGVMYLFSSFIHSLPTYSQSSAELIMTIALALCSYFIVERPANKVRSRFKRLSASRHSSVVVEQST